MLVDKRLEQERLAVCKACPHLVKKTQTCGRLGIGKKVGDVKLCGCVMPVKVKLKTSKCPLNKWQRDMSEMDYEQAKRIAQKHEGKSTVARAQIAEINKAYGVITGKNRAQTSCGPCIKGMLKEMNVAIENGIG